MSGLKDGMGQELSFAGYKDFAECVSKNQDKNSPEGYCASIEKKATGEWPGQNSKEYSIILKNSGKFKVLNYFTDKENPNLKGLKIGGVAITVGKHNNVNYTKEELEPITSNFIGKQLRADHSESIFDVLGKVTNSYWDQWEDQDGEQEGIKFEAIVTNEQVAKNIEMGVADGFSSAFGVQDIVKKGGELYAKGLIPKELSHVCEPADERSRLTELYNSKQLNAYLQKLTEEDKMVEKVKLQDEAPAETKPAVTLEEVLAMIKELSDRLSAIESTKTEEPKAEETLEEKPEDKEKEDEEPKKEDEELSKLRKEVSELKESLSKVETRKSVVTKDEPTVKKLTKQTSTNSWVLIKE